MPVIQYLFKALASGLSLWDSKEKTKYEDKRMELERAYWAEFNKPEFEGTPEEARNVKNPEIYRNSSIIGNIEFELCILAEAFYSASARK